MKHRDETSTLRNVLMFAIGTATSAIFSFNNLETKTRFLVKFYTRAAVLMYFISDGSFQCKPMSTSKRKSISGVLKPCIVDLSCQVFGKRQDFR